ncbi:conserved domain protein [delta proteobacterium NaphS2]|nr:conserved domain protein [delta proteobacterium NaphS2]
MFGPYARLVFEYVEKFGTNPIRMKSRKILRRMSEVSKLLSSGRFSYLKRAYSISRQGVPASLSVVNNKHFESPLESHNYLKKVMIQVAERQLKEKRDARDRDLRKRGSQGRFSDDEISIGEFARQTNRDVVSLAGMIGRKMP